jgi:hypothetical protein
MADLKEEIKEIIEIVALVPESLKVMCFEMLLKDALAKRHSPPKSPVHAPVPPAPEPKTPKGAAVPTAESDTESDSTSIPAPGVQPKVSGGTDITLADLHMKTKKFMEKGSLTLEHINNVFYKEGDKFELLITDLGATNMAEGQIRIASMQALKNALVDGEFTTTVNAVREECKIRKCYDQSNFTANFKKNVGTFDFGEWSKDIVELRLSEDGKKVLAEVVKTLS